MPPSLTTSISQRLYEFSPLGGIIANKLGLQDKNGNGVIDKDAGEGYEEFIERYGNADVGFHANGVVYGTSNDRLEEPEIANHYYVNIRFNPIFTEETDAIESEVNAYIYANKIPLVWLDDEQGTVMTAVTRILGEGWNEQNVTESEAVRMFRRTVQGLKIRGLITADPFITGYNQLPDLIENQTTYCFEIAQFYFWFLSQLEIRSVAARTALTSSLMHDVVKLTNSTQIFDYFNTSAKYRISNERWQTLNPIQSLSEYYIVQAKKENHSDYLEQAVIYNKYDLTNISLLMKAYSTDDSKYDQLIALGEHILQNIDIDKIMRANHLGANTVKSNLRIILLILIKTYGLTKNQNKIKDIEHISKQYFGNDKQIKQFIEYYSY